MNEVGQVNDKPLVWGRSGRLTLRGAVPYAHDPEAFCSDVLRVAIWDKFAEFLWAVHDHKKVTVRGCFGSGKTFSLACVCLWFVCTHEDSRFVTTAPTGRQVRDLLWTEIRRLCATSAVDLGGRCLTDRYEINEKWFGLGFSTSDSGDATNFQGYHAPYVLYAIDEATGVTPGIYGGSDKLCVGNDDRFVTIGNPTDPATKFGDSFKDPSFYKIKISAYDCPNVKAGRQLIPGMVGLEWVKDKELKWPADSPAFLAKVLAEFPESSEDCLIPLRWVTESQERWKDLTAKIVAGVYEPEGVAVLGVDVARGGMDETIFTWRRGNFVERQKSYTLDDTVQIANEVEAQSARGYYPCIDVIGIGAGVYDTLRSRKVPCAPIVGSEKSMGTDLSGLYGFTNVRSELMWKLRERLDPNNPDRIAIPDDDYLTRDLTTPKWKNAGGAKIQVEPKESLKQRLGRSPDRGDSLAYSFGIESTKVGLVVSQSVLRTDRYKLRGDYARRTDGTREVKR